MTAKPSDAPPPTGAPRRPDRISLALAAIPVLALTLGIPFANRLEPRIAGLPFLLAYIAIWILLTPCFMLAVYRRDHPPTR
jgi:hypothetical protein